MIKLINILIMALTIATGSGGEPQATYRIDYAGGALGWSLARR